MRIVTLLLVLAAVVAAQDLTHKAAPQKGPIAIVNGTVHPVSGAPIENGYVLFDKGKIVDVGKGPRNFNRMTEVIDAKGKHVYPGFIGASTTMGLTEIGSVRATRDSSEIGSVKPEVFAAVAVNPDTTLIPVARSNGVLTFASYPGGGTIPGRVSILRADGWTWEDLAIVQDAGLVVSWPFMRSFSSFRFLRSSQAPSGGGDRVQRALARVQKAFDDARAYVKARDADPSVPVDIRWEAMRDVLAGKKPVFIQANDYDQIVSAVHWAMKEKLRPIIVGGTDAHLCTDILRKHEVGVIVGSIHRQPKRNDSDFDESYGLPAKLERAGIKWCLASGQGSTNERNLPYAAGRASAYGLAKDAALKAITIYAARILGLEDQLGTLESGKRATLFVANGDPLEFTTKIERAFVDGRDIDLSNKHTKLYEKYLEKYRQLGLIK